MIQDPPTPTLVLHPDGYWIGSQSETIAYPDTGNRHCFAVEDESFWFRHRNAVIVTVLQRFPPGGAIVDVGAGNGFVSLAMRQAGFQTITVEPGPTGAANAVSRGLPAVICSTFEGAGFASGSVDAIGTFDVLEHVEDDEALLRSFAAALRPAGRLFMTVPAFPVLWSRDDEYAQHFRRYTITSVSTKLRRSGFRVLWATYFFACLPPFIFAVRTVPSWLGLRSHTTPRLVEREHVVKRRVAASMLNALLSFELRRLRSGRGLAIGGSCLLVAEKDDSR